MISFDLMIRGEGIAYVQLSVDEASAYRPQDLIARLLIGESGMLPATVTTLEETADATQSTKVVISFPLFSARSATLVLIDAAEQGAGALLAAESASAGSTNKKIIESALWHKKIARDQLKWASRLSYRTKRDQAMRIRDLDQVDTPGSIKVETSVAYRTNIDEDGDHFTFKGFVSFPASLEDVTLTLRDGDGHEAPCDLLLGEVKDGGSDLAPRKSRSFTLRFPTNEATYALCASATNSLEQGFIGLDPVSRWRLWGAQDPDLYKISRPEPYRSYQLKHAKSLSTTPIEGDLCFSIIVPLYKTPKRYLNEMIASVQAQTYQNWELVLVNASPEDKDLAAALHRFDDDARITLITLEANLGIADNTNAGIEAARGDFICFLDHDDLLAPNALATYERLIRSDEDVRVIYSDEDFFSDDGIHYDPHFKSDFNIDLLRCHNYVTHFLACEARLARELMLDARYDGAQDYDFVLRASEKVTSFAHVPEVLYHWRAHANSTAGSSDTKPYADAAGRKALQAHLDRCGLSGIAQSTDQSFIYRICYEIEGDPLVSILIPNKDNTDLLGQCLESLFEKTDYQNFEVIVIENNSTEEATFAYYHAIENDPRFTGRLKVITWKDEFNYAAINNFAAKQAHGEYLLLLNNDIEVIESGWLGSMVSLAQRKDVGAVGAKLLYPDNTIQHVGIALLKCFDPGEMGGPFHVFSSLEADDPCYFRRASLIQDVSAVTGACLLTKKRLFDELGGLDESFRVAFNDVDFCLRIRQAGYLVVFDPEAVLYHYESITRGADDAASGSENYARFLREGGLLRNRWSTYYAAGDPYYTYYCTLPG